MGDEEEHRIDTKKQKVSYGCDASRGRAKKGGYMEKVDDACVVLRVDKGGDFEEK